MMKFSETIDMSIWAISTIIFAVYFNTLSPSIAGGDSGELVSEGCQLGTAHPPGYPLLTMLVYLIKSLLGHHHNHSIAYFVNSSSAILTSLSSLFIGKTILLLSPASNASHGAILAMLLFAFSRLIWQYAVTAEVFPLNTFFASVLVYMTVLYSKHRSLFLLYLGAFVCSLAICNQHTITLFEAPLILWMLYTSRGVWTRSLSALFILSACFLLGLLPYVYLPIAESLAPKAGSWGNLSTVAGFIHHFLRKDYGTFQLFSGASGRNTEGFWIRTSAYLSDLSNTQGPRYSIPILASISCTYALWQCSSIIPSSTSPARASDKTRVPDTRNMKSKSKNFSKPKANDNINILEQATIPELVQASSIESEFKYVPLVLILTLAFYLIVFHSLANLPLSDKLLYGVHQRFWMQPNVIVFVMVGLGYNILASIITKIISSWLPSSASSTAASEHHAYSSWQRYASVISVCMIATVARIQLIDNYSISDQSDADYFRRYAEAIMDPLPLNAVLLVNYDMQWTSLRYKHICEDYRPDLTIINLSMMTYHWFKTKQLLYPHLFFPGDFHSYNPSTPDGFSMLEFIHTNIQQHRIFLTGKFSYPDRNFEQLYELVPAGIASEILPRKQLPSSKSYRATLQQVWMKVLDKLRLPDTVKYPEETWEWTIGRDFKNRLEETTAALLDYAIKDAATEPMSILYAVYLLEVTLIIDCDASSSVYKNAGLAHIHLIQNKHFNDVEPLLTADLNLFSSYANISWPVYDWKAWSSQRVLYLWGRFLRSPDSKLDPQIATIKDIYDKISALGG